MIMEGPLPHSQFRCTFSDFSGNSGFQLCYDLRKIWILLSFCATAYNQYHVNMIGHHHILVHFYIAVMFLDLQDLIAGNLSPTVQMRRLPEQAPSVVGTNRHKIIMIAGII